MSTYSELLRDPRWQRRRLEILSKTDFTCWDCGAADKTLNVHHLCYHRGAKPWEYEDRELRPLCEECHAAWHALKAELDEALTFLSLKQLSMLLGYAQAPTVFHDGRTVGLRDRWHAEGVAGWIGNGARSRAYLVDMAANQEELTPEFLAKLVNSDG